MKTKKMKLIRDNNNKLEKLKALRATVIYDAKYAKRLVSKDYYISYGHYIKNIALNKQIKKLLHTTNKDSITKLFNKAKSELHTKTQGIFLNFKHIYESYLRAIAENKSPPRHSNFLHLVSSLPALYVAYRSIRSNKGVMTKRYFFSQSRFNKLNAHHKSYVNKTFDYPNGISNQTF